MRVADLDGASLVHFAPDNGLSAWLDRSLAEAGVRPEPAMRTSVTTAAPQLAAVELHDATSYAEIMHGNLAREVPALVKLVNECGAFAGTLTVSPAFRVTVSPRNVADISRFPQRQGFQSTTACARSKRCAIRSSRWIIQKIAAPPPGLLTLHSASRTQSSALD